MHIDSKLPNVGTTIFSVMSALANEVGAVNLSQGFPDFPADNDMIELVAQAMRKGQNQYAPMPGLPALRETIAYKTQLCYGYLPDWNTELTVVSGASEAIFNAIACTVKLGDEVIIFEPAYDLYLPVIELFGGKVVPIALQFPTYNINWAEVKQKISPKTRLIIFNTPHNPSGAVWQKTDMLQLVDLVKDTNIFLVSDEVYEHIVFDKVAHESAIKYEEIRKRCFVISSFGKTYHTTGWKLGYCLAPVELTKEFRKVHQFNTFSTNTPMQYAMAEFVKNAEKYLSLPDFYQERRDKFRNMLRETPFELLDCAGTYFQLVSYKHLSNENETDYAIRLTKEIGVATIPVSVFYQNPTDNKVLRFCFAKQYQTLEQGVERILKNQEKLRKQN